MKRVVMITACAALAAWVSSSAVWSAETITPSQLRPNLFGACFLNAQEGWIIGDRGRIYHTNDGAKTLEQLDAGTPRALLSICSRLPCA